MRCDAVHAVSCEATRTHDAAVNAIARTVLQFA
jgi:hypothetical protein